MIVCVACFPFLVFCCNSFIGHYHLPSPSLLSCCSFSSFFLPLLSIPLRLRRDCHLAASYRNGGANPTLVPETMEPESLVGLSCHLHPLRDDPHFYLYLKQLWDQRGVMYYDANSWDTCTGHRLCKSVLHSPSKESFKIRDTRPHLYCKGVCLESGDMILGIEICSFETLVPLHKGDDLPIDRDGTMGHQGARLLHSRELECKSASTHEGYLFGKRGIRNLWLCNPGNMAQGR